MMKGMGASKKWTRLTGKQGMYTYGHENGKRHWVAPTAKEALAGEHARRAGVTTTGAGRYLGQELRNVDELLQVRRQQQNALLRQHAAKQQQDVVQRQRAKDAGHPHLCAQPFRHDVARDG